MDAAIGGDAVSAFQKREIKHRVYEAMPAAYGE